MRVISASYKKIWNLIACALRYIWGTNVLMGSPLIRNTFHNASWSSTIGMRNLICSNIIWVYQCTSIDSYKCLWMIFIIQLVYQFRLLIQIELLNTCVSATVHIYKWAFLWSPLLQSHRVLAYRLLSMRSYSWEIIQPYEYSCVC